MVEVNKGERKRPMDHLSGCQQFVKGHSIRQLKEVKLTPGNANPQGTSGND